MKKRIIAAAAAAAVMLASGCGAPAQTTSAPAETTTAAAQKAETSTEAPAETTAPEETDEPEPDITEGDDEQEGVGDKIKSFHLSVDGDGKMQISRAMNKNTAMGDDGTWTVFVYLCGTDLESDGYAGSSDLYQMMESSANDNVKFVVQTGGSAQWYENVVPNDKLTRYVVKDGDMFEVDSQPLASMGSKDTLEDFIRWGVENYPAEKMGFVFWDHGGGSIGGACVDELHNYQTLSLADINEAFANVYDEMTDKFEFIGFDCCLMGTLETANILASYARYFYGSQESEPGGGWDYTSIGNFIAENPGATGGELGKVLADSFYEECKAGEQESDCTFSIVDLGKLDDLITSFNDYAKELYENSADSLAKVVRAVEKAENFGGNNKSEGYTNMVDLGGIVNQCAEYADGSAVLAALKNCLVYNINGVDHKNATGLSIYYPLQIQGSSELKTFSGITTSPYYLSLVDQIAKGYTDNGYSNEVFFTEDGNWESYDYDGGSGNCFDDSYFDYADEESDGKSELVAFAEEPHFNDEHIYSFRLTPESLEYVASVSANVYMDLGEDVWVDLGETFDISENWETGEFGDMFDGSWYALYDGQYLATYIVDYSSDFIMYTSPIMLNGERTNLRIKQTADGFTVEGAWDGIDENGMAAREIRKLKAGDKVTPVYYISDIETGEEIEYSGSEYSWASDENIAYNYLWDGDYAYSFTIEDVYGDFYFTDEVIFTVDEDGQIYYNE